MIAEVVFWASIALVFYAYCGYAIALGVLSLFRNRPVQKGNVAPTVSFIIAAHNEQTRIRDKIENTLGQDYPSSSIEIIVASDCSTDQTDALVSGYAGKVRLVRTADRRGKEAAQQLGVESARGDAWTSSDVATPLPPDGVSTIFGNLPN